jgi:hypothetical protein
MKKYILLSISILILLAFSCKKDNTIPTKGTITLSSQLFTDGPAYAAYGFSFETGAILKYPEKPVDLLVIALKTLAGDVDGAIFESSDRTGIFNNTYYNSLMDSSQNYFNHYSLVTDTIFTELSDTVKAGQIITYKTPGGKYAKFLVQSTNIVQGNQQYVEVNISWVFQPNGSRKF